MNMSFWNHCQGLVRRLQRGHMVQRRRVRCWSLLAEALEARTLLSSTPAMVADITPGAGSSGPSQMIAIGSTTYFVANDGVHGNELWKSDGTAAGTSMVEDIWAGGRSSYVANLTDVNGMLYFAANDGVHGEQLWKCDGTAAGTTMVTDFNVGLSTNPGTLTAVNGTLFFAANNGFNGNELWKSNGTAAGTTMVDDIFPGGYTGYYGGYYVNSFNPSNLTNVNGTLFFTADVAPNNPALFKSDGTAAGTVMLTSDGFIPSNLTNVNGTLFFTADDGVHGDELWKSDGTVAGTAMVKDIYPGGTTYSGYYGSSYFFNSSTPRNLTNVNGTLFFAANDGTDGTELWKSDGTDAGTVLVADINPGSASSYPGNLTNVNGTLFFSASDGMHGRELWKSDGTAATTMMDKDISPGGSGSYPSWLTNVNGTLFFQAADGIHGEELWKSDGTVGGTVMVADINPGSASSIPANLTDANGTLFFSANDGVHGNELWALNTAPAPSLAVSGFPTTTTAGAVGSFTITAQNHDGSTNTSYMGTILLSSTDSKAIFSNAATTNPLASDAYTFTAADKGTHTFTVQFKTAGSQSITAVDTQNASDSGAETGIVVNPAAASTMTVSGFPSTITAGTSGHFTVRLKDAYGNIATGYTGTVHFTSSDAKAVLPANYTFTTGDAGVHTFSATLKTAGTQSISVADTLMSALKATEGGITVNAAAASKFIISAPITVTAGLPFSLTLTVEDAYGNVVTGYTGTIHFTSTDNWARLPANYTFTALDKGVHKFTGLVLRSKGKQTITITDMRNSSLTVSVIENVM